MRAGLISGSIAAIVAALVSLPLHSPVDNVFNTASVAAASLLVGVAAGLVWGKLAASQRRVLYYTMALALGLIGVVALAAVGEIWLERMLSYSIPLAVIAFAVSGVVAPSLGRVRLADSRWSAPALLIAAAVIGIGLVGQGDAESGDLALPGRAGAPTAVSGLLYTVGQGSEITFTVREKLSRLPLPNDAVVRTDSVTGYLNLDGEPSEVSVDLHSLASDQSFRDRYIRGQMFPNSPVAVFTVNDLDALPPEFFDGETFTRQVSGTLNVNGSDFPLTFDLEIRNDGDVLNVLGRTEFTWDQLQIRVPNVRNIVSVEDKVSVQILLVAELG